MLFGVPNPVVLVTILCRKVFIDSIIVFFGTSMSFSLHGLIVRNDAEVEQAGIWEDLSNEMRSLIFFPQLVDVSRVAWRVPCQLAQEIVLFGNCGFDIAAGVFGADLDCEDFAVCWKR